MIHDAVHKGTMDTANRKPRIYTNRNDFPTLFNAFIRASFLAALLIFCAFLFSTTSAVSSSPLQSPQSAVPKIFRVLKHRRIATASHSGKIWNI